MNNVVEKINSFQARRQLIREDRQLSDVGKTTQETRLKNEIDAYRPTAFDCLASDWQYVRRQYNLLTVRTRVENELAAGQWDYSRLNYASDAVRSSVRGASDLAAVERQYSQAVAAGDRYAIRAWGEIGVPEIDARFPPGSMDRGHLTRRINEDLAAVMTTPGLQAVNAAGKELADEILALHKDTQAVSQFYNGDNALWGMKDEFQALMADLRITRKTNMEDLTHFETITVEFIDAPDAVLVGETV
jgi:hypothetical protein